MLIDSINERVGDFLEIEKDDAGIHLIAWLRRNLDDQKVVEGFAKTGVYATPLSHYCVSEKLRDGILFGYSGVNRRELDLNIIKLQTVLGSMV